MQNLGRKLLVLLTDPESHGPLFRVGPETPSLRLAVQIGRIGKYGNFPKPSLGNLANFRELTHWLLLGFS